MKSQKKDNREEKRQYIEKHNTQHHPVVNVYAGSSKESKSTECECDDKKQCDMPNILEEQDAQGIIMQLAPELYRSLLAKSYLLDLCNLNRMRQEQSVCAVACDPKAYNRWACCEKEDPCCVTPGTAQTRAMVEVRKGPS